MKKVFLILSLFLSIFTYMFGAEKDFYDGNELSLVLYVNSPEGLRVRDGASLSAKKIGVLYDRMKVKPLEIGKEVTIDGIKSNWVRILMPIESVNEGKIVSGWVFGGYLSKKCKPFSTKGWTDADLMRFMGRFSWGTSESFFYNYTTDGKYSSGKLESSAGGVGTFTASVSKMQVIEKASYGDDQGDFGTSINAWNIITLNEDNLVAGGEGAPYTMLPSMFINIYFQHDLFSENPKWDSFDMQAVNALFYDFTADYIKKWEEEKYTSKTMYTNLMKMGIVLEWNEEYMKTYKEYWKVRTGSNGIKEL